MVGNSVQQGGHRYRRYSLLTPPYADKYGKTATLQAIPHATHDIIKYTSIFLVVIGKDFIESTAIKPQRGRVLMSSWSKNIGWVALAFVGIIWIFVHAGTIASHPNSTTPAIHHQTPHHHRGGQK